MPAFHRRHLGSDNGMRTSEAKPAGFIDVQAERVVSEAAVVSGTRA